MEALKSIPIQKIDDEVAQEEECVNKTSIKKEEKTTRYVEFYDIFQKPIDEPIEYLGYLDETPDGAVCFKKFDKTSTLIKFGSGFTVINEPPNYQEEFELVRDTNLRELDKTNGLGFERLESFNNKLSFVSFWFILIISCIFSPSFMYLFLPLLVFWLVTAAQHPFNSKKEVARIREARKNVKNLQKLDKFESSLLFNLLKYYPFFQKIF